MRKGFYSKLAVQNIEKNRKTYIPYMLTCTLTVAMYYMIGFLATNEGLDTMLGSDYVRSILGLGAWVTAIFAVIFLFYTNSFLMKRRKKEFGLYNILGMEKKHLARVIFYETLYIAVISLAVGLLLGVLLSKLMVLVLLNLFHVHTGMGFSVSPGAIVSSLRLFGIIFLCIFLNSVRQIQMAKPIELLHGGELGEKEPKTKWVMAALGLICLGAGYAMSITMKNPLMVLILFFAAVVLVIVGTYFLFTAGSIAVLKLLRRSKSYYYRTNHFISLSGMIYRMKQNAVGLASICILSTMVLVMISATVSLYSGVDDSVAKRYPGQVNVYQTTWEQEDQQEMLDFVHETAAKRHISVTNERMHRSMSIIVSKDDNRMRYQDQDIGFEDLAVAVIVPLEDHNALNRTDYELAEDEILVYADGEAYEWDTLELEGRTFRVQQQLTECKEAAGQVLSNSFTIYYFIMREETARALMENEMLKDSWKTNYSFDVPGASKEAQESFREEMNAQIRLTYSITQVELREEAREDLLNMYGGLFFLGLFLGSLFIMATILIIYYKQISEGYDDRKRFEIMQKVGLSRKEIRKSIHSQVLLVFFLPLVTAGCHLAGAFPAVNRMMSVLNVGSTDLFILCNVISFLIFAVLYVMIYLLTAKAYYRIVS